MIYARYIIVGQGIAGTVLAHTFLKNNTSVVIIDDPALSQASKIAAGLYNPVVFKRLVKSWKVDELLPFMDKFYTDAEQLLNEKFYFTKTIVKLFTEEQEKSLWIKKSDEEVGNYLDKEINQNFGEGIIYNTNGAAEVKHGGNLNVALFLDVSGAYFKKQDIVIKEQFDYQQLIITDKNIRYKNITADKIIFCEGYKAVENPYFSSLPFKLTKGEVITIYAPLLKQTEKVINKSVFILPVGNDLYKVGATYEWADLSELPTEKGKEELVNKLKKVLKIPFEIVSHQAGIRPTVNDRRPLIGMHPQHPVLGIFNGLGTKGVMLAPYFAQHFYNFLELNKNLDEEVTIARFKHYPAFQ
jgi:glycine/D-amino acid oxidase-like deaminating enzyme